MKKTLLLLALAAGFTFTSCDKDDDATPSKTEMLTGKNWKVTAETVSVNNGPASDVYKQKADCSKDDFTTYATGGKVTLDMGATKCAANEVQTQEGTWEFTENESKLKVAKSGSTNEFSINELSASKMVLTQDQSFTSNGTTTTYQYVTTFEVK